MSSDRLYQEATPASHHSYGLSSLEPKVIPTRLMDERRYKVLQSNATLRNLVKEAEMRDQDQDSYTSWRYTHSQNPYGSKNIHARPKMVWPVRTERESQNIGWYVDPERLAACKLMTNPTCPLFP